ncbi:hypothetical protein CC78DRAFT_579634 [Lojkania enalia]|uniref:Uncharacterized protein n=1 Tax=Lojkania enalia TaxID=147567 RepID=A0A9P4N458_9PLEO|nr:hypothetical protein CC78DRAFT_579634 [Didymosphaeria enalia]
MTLFDYTNKPLLGQSWQLGHLNDSQYALHNDHSGPDFIFSVRYNTIFEISLAVQELSCGQQKSQEVKYVKASVYRQRTISYGKRGECGEIKLGFRFIKVGAINDQQCLTIQKGASVAIGVLVGIAGLATMLVCMFLFLRRRRRKRATPTVESADTANSWRPQTKPENEYDHSSTMQQEQYVHMEGMDNLRELAYMLVVEMNGDNTQELAGNQIYIVKLAADETRNK